MSPESVELGRVSGLWRYPVKSMASEPLNEAEIGTAKVRVDQRDERCVLVNVDPDTTARDPRILRAIARERNACLGVYGTTVRPGRVRLGDCALLIAPATARAP
jgi:uncharacterized protein YcbX